MGHPHIPKGDEVGTEGRVRGSRGLQGVSLSHPTIWGQGEGGPGSGPVMAEIGLALRVCMAAGVSGGWGLQAPGHSHKGAESWLISLI